MLRGKTIKITHSTSLILCYEARGTSTDINKPAVPCHHHFSRVWSYLDMQEHYFCHHSPGACPPGETCHHSRSRSHLPQAGDTLRGTEHPQGHWVQTHGENLPESREFCEKVVLKILCAVLRKTSSAHRHKQPRGSISYFMYSQRPAADRCAFTDWHLSPPTIINQQTCCRLKISKYQREI